MRKSVTVLMSVYNEESRVAATVKSILNQSFKNFEFWIIDDGSTDSTWKVLQTFKDPRLKLIRQKSNKGMTACLNEAIRKIKTPFIARMDSHNLAKTNRLKKQYLFMLAHPEVMALGSNFTRVDEKGKQLLKTNFPTTYIAIKRTLMEKNVFKHASMFIRKDVFEKLGLYDTYFRITQDYDFILRVAAKYPVANLPESLITDIQRQQNTTRRFPGRTAWESLLAQIKGLTRYGYPIWQAVYLLRGMGFLIKSLVL